MVHSNSTQSFTFEGSAPKGRGRHWPETPVYEFKVSEAKKLLAKKNEEA